jgi:hypothetical protein
MNLASRRSHAAAVVFSGTHDSDHLQHRLTFSILLHLLPGAVATVTYLAIAPLFIRSGLPALLALVIAGNVCLVPLELGHLLVLGRRHNSRWSLKGVVLYRTEQPMRSYLKSVSLVCGSCGCDNSAS